MYVVLNWFHDLNKHAWKLLHAHKPRHTHKHAETYSIISMQISVCVKGQSDFKRSVSLQQIARQQQEALCPQMSEHAWVLGTDSACVLCVNTFFPPPVNQK